MPAIKHTATLNHAIERGKEHKRRAKAAVHGETNCTPSLKAQDTLEGIHSHQAAKEVASYLSNNTGESSLLETAEVRK
jgi:hypothetical protein